MILYKILAYLTVGLLFLPLSTLAKESDLTKQIKSLKLWESRDWKRLLHDERSLFGDSSEADSGDFFLTKNGNRNYKEELFELLKQTTNLKEVNNKHAICRFPARTKWLYKQLKLPLNNLPFNKCIDFQNYLKLVESESSSIVFSSYYLESPASAFGHTLLKLKRKKGKFHQDTDLLDMGINYSAQVTTDNAILYALFGLIGVFKGSYSAIPYFYKVREYNDFESRDLWTYDLNFSPEQHQRLLDHLWEVGNTYFYYYYFTENCSYNLLTILEVARFDIELTTQLPSFYTIPSHTIQAIYNTPNLVKGFSATPSLRKKFDYNFKNLSPEHRKILLAAYQTHSIEEIKQAQISEDHRTQIIDSLILYIDFLHAKQILLNQGSISKWKNQVLAYRSELGKSKVKTNSIVNTNEAPHLGHGPRRLGVGLQTMRENSKISNQRLLEYRFALHSFMDYKMGQPEYATLEFLDIGLKENKGNWDILKVDLVEVMALNPITQYKTPVSLKAKFGWLESENRCDGCTVFATNLAGGLSFVQSSNIFYTFLGIKTESSNLISKKNALSMIPEIGIKSSFSDSFALNTTIATEVLTENGLSISHLNADFNYYIEKDSRLRINTFIYERNNFKMAFNYYYYY